MLQKLKQYLFQITASQSTSNPLPTSQQTSSKPNKDVKENNSKPKKPAVVQDENHFVQNTNKGRLVPIINNRIILIQYIFVLQYFNIYLNNRIMVKKI